MQRPDLSQSSSEVRDYIAWLESENARLQAAAFAAEAGAEGDAAEALPPLEPSEPPTTRNVVVITRSGLGKRTPRHLYLRQRRGGMGVFDVEAADDDPAATLLITEERSDLLVLTSRGRAFRLPVYFLDEAIAVRTRPQPFMVSVPLAEGEHWAVAVPAQTQGHLAVVSQQGFVRALPGHLFSETMRAGLAVFRPEEAGAPAAACWAPSGDSDLFLATRRGLAVRFPLKQVPTPGGPGLRLEAGDSVVAITAVRPAALGDTGVLLVGADGRGTIRLMSGFAANKAPGAGGKLALKTDALIGASAVDEADDVFILSQQNKIIRFKAGEIPAKEGVVQGVNCMALRADQCLALAVSRAAA